MDEISEPAPNTVDAVASGATRRRILFIAEAVTLAHVARAHALARTLDPERFEICIACDPRYDALIGPHRFATHAIHSIASAEFAAALERGRPIYDLPTLIAYVEEDRRAIDAFKADVVVGDFRLSLGVSARLAGIPYINITNAGWSPYARLKFTVPEMALVGLFGVRFAQAMFDIVRPLAFALHAMPFNRLRKHFGLTALPLDLRYIYTEGDFTLYADVPEMFAFDRLPRNHDFLGAVLWSPPLPLPSWWDAVSSTRPIVYVTLGSSGQSASLPVVLDVLGALPVTVIAATAGRIVLENIPPNTHVADYLPGSLAAARASAVICNGGSPTCYQALAAGVPVIGIANNLDQYLNMRAVDDAGAGLLIRTQQVRKKLADYLNAILIDTSFGDAARRLQAAIDKHHPSVALERALSSVTSNSKS